MSAKEVAEPGKGDSGAAPKGSGGKPKGVFSKKKTSASGSSPATATASKSGGAMGDFLLQNHNRGNLIFKWGSIALAVMVLIMSALTLVDVLMQESAFYNNATTLSYSANVVGVEDFNSDGAVTTGGEQYPGLVPPNDPTQAWYVTNYDFQAIKDSGLINPNSKAALDWGNKPQGALTNDEATFIMPLQNPGMILVLMPGVLQSLAAALVSLLFTKMAVGRQLYGWRVGAISVASFVLAVWGVVDALAQFSPTYTEYRMLIMSIPVISFLCMLPLIGRWAKYRSLQRSIRKNYDPQAGRMSGLVSEKVDRVHKKEDLKDLNENDLATKKWAGAHLSPMTYDNPDIRVSSIGFRSKISEMPKWSKLRMLGWIGVVLYLVGAVSQELSLTFGSAATNNLVMNFLGVLVLLGAALCLLNVLAWLFWPFKTDRHIYQKPLSRAEKKLLREQRKIYLRNSKPRNVNGKAIDKNKGATSDTKKARRDKRKKDDETADVAPIDTETYFNEKEGASAKSTLEKSASARSTLEKGTPAESSTEKGAKDTGGSTSAQKGETGTTE